MLRGIKQVFRPKPKQKSGGTSRITRRVSIRLTNQDYDIAMRRASCWEDGKIAPYLTHLLHRELNRDHHKKKETKP